MCLSMFLKTKILFLLLISDVDVPSPDEKSIMTYVSFLQNKFPQVPDKKFATLPASASSKQSTHVTSTHTSQTYGGNMGATAVDGAQVNVYFLHIFVVGNQRDKLFSD